MKENISILVCTGNRCNQLKRCLESILEQEGNNVDELLILDSSSTNYCSFIAKIIGDKINFQYFRTKVRSIPYSRNFLLKKAKNNLCLFVDDDVCLDENAVLKCFSFFKKNPDIAVVGGVGYPRYEDNIYSFYSFKRLFFESLIAKNAVIEFPFCPTMICCLQKDKLIKHQIKFDFKMKNLEDVDLCLNLIKHGERIYINKEIKGVHEYRTNFISFYRSFYNYYLYSGLIYKKYGKDFFDIKRFFGKMFWIKVIFYLFDTKGDSLFDSFSGSKLINIWLYFLRKWALIMAVRRQKINKVIF